MTIPGFIPGWRSDPNYVRDQIADRASLGHIVTSSKFCDETPQLKGTWQRKKARGVKGVFLRDRELRLLGGSYRRPMFQKRGTCVSRGTYRGVQTSLDVSIVDNLTLQIPVSLSFAPIYSLARHECGKDRCGSEDGALLCDAMRAIHDFGVATSGLFPGTSEDDVEKIAVKYAAPGIGTPSSWITACRAHTCVTFWPETLEMIFDCIAAGYAVPYACGYITGMPDRNGLSRLGDRGGHCRCFVGVYLDEHGESQLESSESWGRFPAGEPQREDSTMNVMDIPCIKLNYAGGTHELAPGDVGVDAKQFWESIQDGGEAWAVSAPKYIANGLAELSDGKAAA